MVKLYLIVLVSLFISCNVKTRYVKEGYAKIPFDEDYFTHKIRNKYPVIMPLELDTESVYREVYFVSDGIKYESKKFKYHSLLKFYKNGCVNDIVIDSLQKLEDMDLNPANIGYRGVVYTKKNREFISVFAPVFENLRRYKLHNYILKISGDTLFMKNRNDSFITAYVKEKVSNENIDYKANW